MTSTGFSGFSDETLAFYDGLEADNSKAYWTDHREMYERAVRGPMLALVAALEGEFGPAKMFRPHRDVRFSADKSPYKNHQGAVVEHPGVVGSWYVQISASGIMTGGGVLRFSKDQLGRYRAAVGADRTGVPFARAVATLTSRGYSVMGDSLKRAPRGMDPDHPRVDLLRHKGLAIGVDRGDPEWFVTAECLDRVARSWREVTPVLDWLGENVGPAEPAD